MKTMGKLEGLSWIIGGICLATVALIAFVIWRMPENSLHPFCTYTSQYEIEATLQVGDEVLRSSAARQRSLSRRWIQQLNSAGCQQVRGRALIFKSRDGLAYLIGTDLCPLAEEVLLDTGSVDVIQFCKEKWPNSPVGFVIDSAENPTSWRPFNFLNGAGSVVLLTMKARETNQSSRDEIGVIAPNILKTRFDDGGHWWMSPSRLLWVLGEKAFQARKVEEPAKPL